MESGKGKTPISLRPSTFFPWPVSVISDSRDGEAQALGSLEIWQWGDADLFPTSPDVFWCVGLILAGSSVCIQFSVVWGEYSPAWLNKARQVREMRVELEREPTGRSILPSKKDILSDYLPFCLFSTIDQKCNKITCPISCHIYCVRWIGDCTNLSPVTCK